MNMPMPSRFIPNADDCQMVSEGRADELSRSDKQRILFDIPEALRFRIDLRQCLALLKGDLYTRQRQSQGDDMLFTLVFPGKQLWKYQVSNILGLLSDFLVQKHSLYVHFHDLCLEVASGESILLQYSFLDVAFVCCCSQMKRDIFTSSYRVCSLTLFFRPNIEPLNSEEEMLLSC